MYLSEVSNDRNNNLDIIRFFAAILVIVGHSFPLSGGRGVSEYLSRFTSGRLSLGGVAVGIFFLFGGFLIAKSMENKKTAKKFFSARCKRIFPSVIFVVFILTFIVGPIISNLSTFEYLTNKQTYAYLANALLIPIHNLPGVFENNVYEGVVNGSLWTLPVEFLCYILIYIAYKLKFFDKKKIVFTIPIVGLVAIGLVIVKNNFIISVLRPIILYYVGLLAYIFRDRIKLSRKKFLFGLISFVILVCIKLEVIAMIVAFPYVAFYLAFGCKYKFKNFAKKGDISYGMYLWGWPIGQIVCMMFGGEMKWYINATITVLLSIFLGYITFIIVDKKILSIFRKKK